MAAADSRLEPPQRSARTVWTACTMVDKSLPLRQSHKNPDIQTLYKEFLHEPNSHLAHELLHTHYTDRSGK